MNNNDWFTRFDQNKSNMDWFFTVFYFDKEWKCLLEFRRRRQRKKMLNVLQQVFRDMPTEFTTITEESNPIGLQEFINLLEG